MRALVVTIWVFINLVFFGMCGYMYLLWSQYWLYLDRQTETTTSTYDQQIYFYNRGYLPSDINKTLHNASAEKSRVKHSTKDNSTVTLVKNSKPRFPYLQRTDFDLDSNRYVCWKNESSKVCDNKTAVFKDKLLKELRKVLADESNVLKIGLENPYNVHYEGRRKNFMNKAPKEILCELKEISMSTLKRSDVQDSPIKNYLPKRGLFENKNFNSCAIIASAGALKGSKLGKLIDSHDLVLRFNHAPTKGFERDVGKKTTIRVLNSQVMSKPEFKFLKADLYKNITVVVWDPSNYSSTLNQWLEKPEFNFFPNYIEYRKRNTKPRLFMLNPRSLWDVWDFLQSNSPSRLRRNPPSSGFLGLALLLPFCNFVDIFEYVPSTRVTKRCHYYDPEDNPACTFGVWHPLAAEKLLTYYLNVVNNTSVFQTGFVRITGFKDLKC